MKVGSLNIQGSACAKCETEDVRNKIRKHHIFVIVESMLEKHNACPQIPSYTPYRTERVKHPRAFSNSGGIIIYISHSIVKGVTKVKARAHSGGDAIWIKLDKMYFGLHNDIYLCGGYMIPRADEDLFEVLRKEIEMFSNYGIVSLIGDYTSRLATLQPNHFILLRGEVDWWEIKQFRFSKIMPIWKSNWIACLIY